MEHTQHVEVLLRYPAHPARTGRAKHLFDQVRARLKAQGLLRCVVCGATDAIELHHTLIEHSLQSGIDVNKLDALFGLHLTDAEFVDWINSPANLEPLCVECHRGTRGVHLLSEPLWNAVRCWRSDLPALTDAHGNI